MTKSDAPRTFRLRPLKSGLLILLLGGSVFLFFRGFFDLGLSPLSTEILAAVLGSILTVLVTMMLLDKQTLAETKVDDLRRAEATRFQHRIELYQDFITTFTSCAADGELSVEELQRMEQLALQISLFTEKHPEAGDPNLGEVLCAFVLQLEIQGLVFEGFGRATERSRPLLEAARRAAGKPADVPIQFSEILHLMRKDLQVVSEHAGPIDSGSAAQHLLDYRGYRRWAAAAGDSA